VNRRFLAAAPIALLALGLAACGGHNSPGASVPSIFTPGPTSTQVKAAESAGQQLLAKCQPKGDTTTAWEVAFVFHPKTTATALENCENVPPAKRQALAVCVLGAAKTIYKSGAGKADKEAAFLDGTAVCVKAAQGVTASATPVPSASAK
jgi:hypothetical protein